jgi:3-hydroxyisobutyrate dehydrogenase-like beta-hydroxyacid dehydrogenase
MAPIVRFSPEPDNMTLLAFIGFGEVGRTFARGLAANKGVRLAAYDLLFDDPEKGPARITEAKGLGVRAASDAADASADARVVISAVTAAATLGVAEAAARHLRPGQIFLDVNSASPSTKKRAAEHVAGSGARYVEGAVMAAVAGPGLKVPILAGGPSAPEAAEILNPLGMNLTPVAAEWGRASAMKLSRSIVMKGIEAAMVEMTAAARAWDVEREVIASLQGTYPGIDWTALSANCTERVAKHGIRRAQEMQEAGDMLQELGLDPALCRAIAATQQRGAKR